MVVWTKRNGEWVKIAILKSGPEWKKSHTVPLILSRGHFMTLRHQKGHWPKEWVIEAGDDIPCSQGLDTQITEMNPVLGRGGMLSTPLNKVRKKIEETEDDWASLLKPCSSLPSSKRTRTGEIEDLLRPCSSRPSTKSCKKDQDWDSMLRTCSSRKSAASSHKEVKKFSTHGGPGKRRIRKPNVRIIVKGDTKTWKCPPCDEVLDITKGDTIDRKKVEIHISRNHPKSLEMDRRNNAKFGRLRTGLGLRELTWPIEFVKLNKSDMQTKAQFVCPLCDMCMPKQPQDFDDQKLKYLLRISKIHHLGKCKKAGETVSLRKYQSLYVKKYPEIYRAAFRSTLDLKGKEKRIQQMINLGHDPVVIEFANGGNKAQYGYWMMICKKCRTLLRPVHFGLCCRKSECSGKVPIKTSPGIAFWKTAKGEGVIDATAKKLGMKAEEVAHVKAALERKAAQY